ncbi:R3H and coiled-coil domain-containing protein 1 [Tetrabaena socialis]|uniref:R3H and coiled-coil domain-containing protein 1 n=1 Tax=Tetrabaena socialis TaxID=47790 RepID=A0A2J8AEW1_9CHLO|nr:R3H and coiled-coil domain-containing protein 1 [Tetrabaena socialis]|eukprot:PNH11042.1 R3H and coiled-coil domain-containing protein 1 [Tetrabaena socialis]
MPPDAGGEGDDEEAELRAQLAGLQEEDPAYCAVLSDLAVLALNKKVVPAVQKVVPAVQKVAPAEQKVAPAVQKVAPAAQKAAPEPEPAAAVSEASAAAGCSAIRGGGSRSVVKTGSSGRAGSGSTEGTTASSGSSRSTASGGGTGSTGSNTGSTGSTGLSSSSANIAGAGSGGCRGSAVGRGAGGQAGNGGPGAGGGGGGGGGSVRGGSGCARGGSDNARGGSDRDSDDGMSQAMRAAVGGCTHVVEVYGLTTAIRTVDLEEFLEAVSPQDGRPLPLVRWVDDNHALFVCPDGATALLLLQEEQDIFSLRPYEEASAASKAMAKAELLPPRERPKTTAAVAKKMLSHALGMNQLRDREGERDLAAKRKAAKEMRRERAAKLAETWDDP